MFGVSPLIANKNKVSQGSSDDETQCQKKIIIIIMRAASWSYGDTPLMP